MTALPACAVVAVITAFAVSQTPQLSSMLVAVAAAVVAVLAMVVALAVRSLSRRAMFGDRIGQHRRPGVAGLLTVFATSLIVVMSGLGDLNRWVSGLPSTACEESATTVMAVVDGLPETPPGSLGAQQVLKFPARALGWQNSECSNVVRLNVFIDRALAEQTVWVGDVLAIEGRVSRPWGRVNPAALEGERYALLRGVHGNFGAKNLRKRSEPDRYAEARPDVSHGLLLQIQRVRQEHSLRIRERVSGAAKRFVPALVLGDRRYLTTGDWERLQVFGLTHLFVVSGLHISLVAGMAYGLTAIAASIVLLGNRLQRNAPVFVSMIAAWAYALIAGFSLPTIRAAIALSCFLLPRLFRRRMAPWDCFCLCVTALMIAQPLSLLGASFWLSAGAVAGILWLSSWEMARSRARRLVRTQVQLSILLIPLSVLWFEGASILGAAANLVLIPMVSLTILPLLLLGEVMSSISEPLGALIEWLPAQLLGVIDSALRYWESRLRASVFLEFRLIVAEAFLLLLVGLLLCLPQIPYRRVVCALLSVSVLLKVSSADRANDSEGRMQKEAAVTMVVFDVGQGTSVLISSQWEALLYDTGGGMSPGRTEFDRAVQPFLKDSIDEISWLVVSHWDHDHAGGVPALRSAWSPIQERDSVGRSLGEACRAGEKAMLGDGVLQFMSSANPSDSGNDQSCVLRFEVYGRAIVLAGDIGVERERELVAYWGDRMVADILLAGHHGSAGSNSHLWLRVVDPSYLVVSAGRNNRFGHPAPKVLRRAEISGTEVHSTIDSGALIYRIWPDGEITCERLRHRRAPLWRAGAKKRDCSVPESAG